MSDEHDLRIAERAWDEGLDAALDVARYVKTPDGGFELPANPYKEGAKMTDTLTPSTERERQLAAKAWNEGAVAEYGDLANIIRAEAGVTPPRCLADDPSCSCNPYSRDEDGGRDGLSDRRLAQASIVDECRRFLLALVETGLIQSEQYARLQQTPVGEMASRLTDTQHEREGREDNEFTLPPEMQRTLAAGVGNIRFSQEES